MRVVHVIDSLVAGGAESSLFHLAPALGDLGIELHVAFLRDRQDLAAPLVAAGVTLHPIELDRNRVRQIGGLRRVIRDVDPDIVHTTLWEADVIGRVAALLARKPVVTSFAASGYSSAHFANPSVRTWKLRGAQIVDGATSRIARRFHAVADHVADDMSRRLRIPRDRIDTIPRARSREMLGEASARRRSAVRHALGLGEERVVLAAARHEFEKGIDVLIDGVALALSHPHGAPFCVLIAGREGRETTRIRQRIDEAGVAEIIQLMGARSDLADLMVAADVVVVPSRTEGFPGVVVEAMALDRPVIASDLPAVREAIGSHAYATCPPERPDLLGVAISRFLSDDSGFAVAAGARQRFEERFTTRAVAQQTFDFYRRALDSRS